MSATPHSQTARLSMLQAAFVVARRDFTAILFSRSFLFFLLGPLFPAVIMAISFSIGGTVAQNKIAPAIAVQMSDGIDCAHGAVSSRCNWR